MKQLFSRTRHPDSRPTSRHGRSTGLAALLVLLPMAGFSAEPDRVDFATQIRPLLSDRCYHCHGPDPSHRKARLRLDVEEGVRGDRQIVVPGKPEESRLYRRISHADTDERMPPSEFSRKLSGDEIELIRRWIEEGAAWASHWAHEAPRRHEPPAEVAPGWVRDPLDAFVSRAHRERGLEAAVPASREAWLRRVTFDLTGLPPTLGELDDFLDDPSPRAREVVVDRLLASRHYGERMAANWLDVARYSDTFGYQVDRERRVWPWRDWVVRAFHENLPFDRFIHEQLAGDLIENATTDQILATAFNRLHPQKVEGGSVPEEFRVEYVADRVETVSTAFLGLTVACARCHDHKYDPISQEEYYRLFAYFNTIDEAGLYSYFTNSTPTPTLRLMEKGQRTALEEIEGKIRETEERLAAWQEEARESSRLKEWLEQERSGIPVEVPGEVLHLDFEEKPGAGNRQVEGRVGQAVQLSGDDGISTKVGNFTRNQPFSVSLWMLTPDHKERAVVFHRSRAWTDSASRGYQLLLEDGRPSASLVHFWPGNAIRVRTVEPVEPRRWVHVTVTYDGSSRASGLRIYLDGREPPREVVRDHLYKNITGSGGDTITIGQRFRDRGFTGGRVDEFRVFDRELSRLEIAQLADGQSLEAALRRSVDELDENLRRDLGELYLARFDDRHREIRKELRGLRDRRSQVADPLPEIMVMAEMPVARPTHVLARGMYDQPTTPVKPGVPAVLAFPGEQPRDRLELARWLTDPRHPLTARVIVNRLWQLMFGEGLVRTPEDFGSQGQPPSHPELLDTLARDFIESGWDVQALLRRIALSATYGQSSRVSAEARRRDPVNRFLTRSARFRLPAEMIRDNVLATSGLLVDRAGGPPSKPYDLAASFKPLKPDSGPGLYRRSLYTYWKRTAPSPTMMTLDASKREVCRVRRERTSSPLQALVILNDPLVIEASRVLAAELLEHHPENTSALLEELFRRLTSRRPSHSETEILAGLLERRREEFASDPEAARRYLAVGETKVPGEPDPARLASLAVVINTMYGFSECVTRP